MLIMKKTFALLIFSLVILSACDTGTSSSATATPQKLGRAEAPVLIEEFSDPQCPACGVISPQVEKIVRENPEVARLEYYNYPLPYHENAFISSEAAECAGDQGKFFEYLGILFQNQNSLTEDFLRNTADSLSLDRTAFDSCLDNHEHKADILAQMAEGNRRKIPGTPTLYVNGQMLKWSDAETFTGYLKSLAN
jgi:protein-disulfide isomerase